MKNHWLDQKKQRTQDCSSLQALAEGDFNLDFIYTWQYVQNEKIDSRGTERFNRYRLEHTPVGSGTLTGTVYRGDEPIQVFVMTSNGIFLEMTDPKYTSSLKSSEIKVTNGNLNLMSGVLDLEWNQEPGVNQVVVSYEYNIEYQYEV